MRKSSGIKGQFYFIHPTTECNQVGYWYRCWRVFSACLLRLGCVPCSWAASTAPVRRCLIFHVRVGPECERNNLPIILSRGNNWGGAHQKWVLLPMNDFCATHKTDLNSLCIEIAYSVCCFTRLASSGLCLLSFTLNWLKHNLLAFVPNFVLKPALRIPLIVRACVVTFQCIDGTFGASRFVIGSYVTLFGSIFLAAF